MFTILLSLFKDKLVYIIGIFVIILICVAMYMKAYNNGYDAGVMYMTEKYTKEKLEWETKVHDLQASNEKTIDNILKSYNEQISDLDKNIDKLEEDLNTKPKIKYVNRYIPVDTNCTIPNGFIKLHNTSAQGKPLESNPSDIEIPSNSTLEDVGSTIAINYYEYNKLVKQIVSLQTIILDFQSKQKELVK